MTYNQLLTFSNDDEVALVLFLEPWGEDYTIPPSKTLKIRVKSDLIGDLEISQKQNILTLFLWSGCLCEIELDGCEIKRASSDIKSP